MSFSRARFRSSVVVLTIALIGTLSSAGRGASGSTIPSNDLDNTFGSGGVVHTNLPHSSGGVRHLAIQADAKILALGDGPGGHALLRYNEDGSLDSGFHVSSPIGGQALALEPNQRILIGGIAGEYPAFKFALIRRNTDGS